MARRSATGSIDVPLSAAEALWLFTPEGERVWVSGWDPVYPAGEPSEAPGTVFTTSAGGVETVWLILEIDRTNHRAAYARLTQGRHAGTVAVECIDNRPGHCTMTIRYDMTALEGAEQDVLAPYEETRFAETMSSWATTLDTHLAGDRA